MTTQADTMRTLNVDVEAMRVMKDVPVFTLEHLATTYRAENLAGLEVSGDALMFARRHARRMMPRPVVAPKLVCACESGCTVSTPHHFGLGSL